MKLGFHIAHLPQSDVPSKNPTLAQIGRIGRIQQIFRLANYSGPVMISSAQMQQNPSVLLRAPILAGKGWSFEAADSNYTLAKADVIDLNQNGVDTYGQGGVLVGNYGYFDPALSVSLGSLKNMAKARHTEVLTSPDLGAGAVQVAQLGVDQRFFTHEVRQNPRSLDQLCRQELPGSANLAWGIDTVKGEFLVFDKGSQGAPQLPQPAVIPSTPAPTVAAPVSSVKPAEVSPAPKPSTSKPAEPQTDLHPTASSHRGGGLIAGYAVAMLSTVVASSVHGPAGLAVLAAGFLGGAALAVKLS